ncbi:MAG TPA: FKBP-type peptidyl-prolyl cis-trans isomerase [Candidatus Eisenbacteria bacterium]|nr:FKBP-type peptidyl-prolyl cis-trans isomerase [Candidatus Eisenbacteria bacterium]
MRYLLVLALTAVLVHPVLAADPQTDDQKAFYALGVGLSKQLTKIQPLSPEEIQMITTGFADSLEGKPIKADPDTFGPKIQEIATKRWAAAGEAEKKKGQEFLEKAAKEKGAKKTESGLIYQEITAGKGDSPKASDTVKVNYRGTLIDGTEFDSSYKRNQPATFPLSGVIKCWTEGVQLMKPGGKAKLVCPSDIAYGERGAPPHIKPGSTLVFEVELLEVGGGGDKPAADKK